MTPQCVMPSQCVMTSHPQRCPPSVQPKNALLYAQTLRLHQRGNHSFSIRYYIAHHSIEFRLPATVIFYKTSFDFKSLKQFFLKTPKLSDFDTRFWILTQYSLILIKYFPLRKLRMLLISLPPRDLPLVRSSPILCTPTPSTTASNL